MHGGIPAAGDQQGVAIHYLFIVTGDGGDVHGGDPVGAVGAGDDAAGPYIDAPVPAPLGCDVRCLRAGVDHGGDLHPGIGEVGGRGVGAVVGGEHHDPATHQHPVAVQVGAGGPGEQDAGTVVVGEHDRAFVGAGGQDDLGGPEPPDPLPGNTCRGIIEVVGAALHGADRTVVVHPERVGPGQYLHVGVGGEFGGNRVDPVAGGCPVDPLVGAE